MNTIAFCASATLRLVALALALVATTSGASAQSEPGGASTGAAPASGAPVEVWNRTIVVIRAPYEGLSPEARAAAIKQRLLAIPGGQPEYRVDARPVESGGLRGAYILVNGQPVLGLLPGDVDVEGGETLDALAERVCANLREWLEAREDQTRLGTVVNGLLYTAAATAGFAILVALVLRFGRRRVVRRLSEIEDRTKSTLVAGANVRPYLIALEVGVLRLVNWGVVVAFAYLWLTFVLRQFPYSQPWSERLSGSLAEIGQTFGQGILAAMPKLAALIVIFLLTRLVVRVVTAFFRGAESGTVEAAWLQPEIARATRRVLAVLIWTFALIVSYPYIPGSETEAFKGVSVFLGLMVSLGSAGLVGQIIGGLVVVYSRAFRIGDFVKVGEHEGTVRETGLLSTRIETVTRQAITIPNAVLIGATVVNYSAPGGGAFVSTAVTIGYDAPWRQVHALLLMAAERTERIMRDPAPFVLQRALADFYAEYRLVFTIANPQERYQVLSELHGHIQDTFNEYGVQIMSPNFVAQPDNPVVVPKEQWFTPPVGAPAAADAAGGAT